MGASLGNKQIRSNEDAQQVVLALIQRVKGIQALSHATPPANPCRTCSGTGIIVIERHMGPQMVSKMQKVCTDCGGPVQPRDSFDRLVVDFLWWARNHRTDEVDLIRSVVDSMMAAEDADDGVNELQKLFQQMKV